ncbi:hypothetical protein MKX03_017178 [Papaver bracteatum]|nr:hypothetical protein MKX03_017178 [Papaver bracteatum]
MNSTLTSEFYVAAPAEDLWDVISAKDSYKTIQMLVPGMFEKLEILEGDGGTGTVLAVVFSPGTHFYVNSEEKVTIDNQRRVWEILQIKGGYLDMGVTSFMESFEIIPKGRNSVYKTMIRYEVPDELAHKVSSLITIEGMLTMAKATAKYVVDSSKKSPNYPYIDNADKYEL